MNLINVFHLVYTGGLYFLGPFTKFIRFPRTVVNIEFSSRRGGETSRKQPPLETRTAEGLALKLHVSFQYRIVKNDIPKLYKLAQTRYEETFLRQAKKVVLEEAGSYNAPEYWLNRKQIGINMLNKLNSTLQKTYSYVDGFQILRIDLPSSYEDSIVQTQVQVQLKETKIFEQEAAKTRESIRVDVSGAEKNVTIINAKADAKAITIVNTAKAAVNKNTIEYENKAYTDGGKLLGMTTGTGLLDYIYYMNLMKLKDTQLIVGLKNSLINLHTGTN